MRKKARLIYLSEDVSNLLDELAPRIARMYGKPYRGAVSFVVEMILRENLLRYASQRKTEMSEKSA